MTLPISWFRRSGLAALLVLMLGLSAALAQDYNFKIGPGAYEEQLKARKELADKLPPEQAAAFLRNQNAWDSVTGVLQWLITAALPVGMAALVLAFRHRRLKVAHETMRVMIDKGLAVPPELLQPPPPKPKNDLRRGLVWVGLGVGLVLSLRRMFSDSNESLWTLGLVPTLVGIAFLVCWLVEVLRAPPDARTDGLKAGIFWTFGGVALAGAMRSMANRPGADWYDLIGDCWAVSLIPIGIGAAYLVHGAVSRWTKPKQAKQA